MGNQWGLGLHLMFVTIFLVATITNTCLGVGNITVACFEHERITLLEFKHSVTVNFEMLSSWVGDDCCLWERVQCDLVTGHVESLHLRGSFTDAYSCAYERGKYLDVNELKSSLLELRHLQYLDLSGNSFQKIRIPEFIGSFKQLTYLNLSNANFFGNIPHHIGNLSNLKVLDLKGNTYLRLMVDDMTWISDLTSLKYLDLSLVDLSKAKNYDIVFYMIHSLEELRLATCDLSGNFPLLNSSKTLSIIKHLDLGNNRFGGQLPKLFLNMTSLQFLDLSGNDLSLPQNFANLLNNIPSLQEVHLSECRLQNMHMSATHLNISTLSNIQLIDLRWNSFEGDFPYVLSNLTSLRVLDLSNCRLNSTIPILPNLLELGLSRNNFKDIEQFGFWRQCHLKRLTMSSNNPYIEMKDSATNVSECSQYSLERLYIDGSFNGTIQESLGRLVNLRGLFLQGNRLTGRIPESLGRLKLLEVLNLSYNQLNGSIPKSLGMLAALKYLTLTGNYLIGPIPVSLESLISLQIFLVSSNLLNGIPVSLGQLSKLQKLDISNNFLEGVVSEAHFYNLSMLEDLSLAFNNKLTINISHVWMPPFQLKRLDLSSCKIADEFPRWLRTQRKLQLLELSNTSISGPLPIWLRRMPIIPYLDLSHNNLSGPLTNLPNQYKIYHVFGQRVGFVLYLKNNVFNGSIPRSLCKRTDLEYLNLSKNKLSGKIPECLGNLQKLKTMIISSNRLSGVVPSSIGQSSSLYWLTLNDNNLRGFLPQELGNLGGLVVLDLGDNKFSGEIPAWIGEKFERLIVLRLHKNNFMGRIPRSFCNTLFLQIFDVAYNYITGPIPHCMVLGANIESFMHDLDESVIQVMKGVELEYTKTLKFLVNMDLSSNKIVGGIPIELTALSGLVGLNLSNNLLTGSIPTNIGKMDALNSLDLSGNQLTGMIPQSMADLHFLSYLNLSYNNLSGRIPTGNQLQTLTDSSIYVGNIYLCGSPLTKNCSNHEDLKTTHNKTTDEPKKVWFYVDVACGFATGFWGIVGVLVLKKEWRQKLFMFSEVTMDKIYVAIVVRVAMMKRRNEAS